MLALMQMLKLAAREVAAMARALFATSLMVTAGLLMTAAAAQDLSPVPRNRTLITQGWDPYNQVPSPTNLSPYNGVLLHQRNSLHYTVNEQLFYINHVTNELVPWQASGYAYNTDFTEIVITLRDGVKWSDGKPFTADDVVFTLRMLRGAAPDMVLSSSIKEWVASEEATDRLHVRIKLAKPGPRWARDVLATGQTTRFIVVPKHIWDGRDPRSFGFFDLAQGWPVGTGPYRVVRSDAASIVFDRREGWWAAETGLAPALPAPERIIYRPATADSWPQLFTNNDIDMGHAIPVGALEAAMARNPRISSWNTEGPVWGTTAGCTLRLAINNQAAPFDAAPVRQAVAALVDRQQIVDLAFEGSAPPALAPFSSLEGMRAYTSQLKDVIEAGAGKPDRARAEKLLTGAGFTHGADSKWRLPGGAPWTVTILTQASDPIGPVLARQFQAAGIDTVFRPTQDTGYFDALTSGAYSLAVASHCGSLYDPWQTLEHFHSKYSAPPGSRIPNIRAITRYANPEMDALLNRMEARQPSPKDAEYMALVRQATGILFRDMPQVTLAEEFHPITWNNNYWTGWPTAKDAYVAPFPAWEGFALVIHRLKPRQ